jgi:hypothetical protein
VTIDGYDLNKAERDMRGLSYLVRNLTNEMSGNDGRRAHLEPQSQGVGASKPPGGPHDCRESCQGAREAKYRELTHVVDQLERYCQRTDEFIRGRKVDLNQICSSSSSVTGRYQKEQYERSGFYLECDIRRANSVYADARNALRYTARVAPSGSGTSSRKAAIDETVRSILASSPEYIPNAYGDMLSTYAQYSGGTQQYKTRRTKQRPLFGQGKSTRPQSLSDKIMAGMGAYQATSAATYSAAPAGSYDPVERNEYGLGNSQR